jgi:medium-chain acyl-[acyl-carrier-protein] hydrolase
MDSLVSEIQRAIDPLRDRPFAFFGHSMGGRVAFELARTLRRSQLEGPSKLFISATLPPSVPDPDPPVHQLPDEEFVFQLKRRYDAIPKGVLENRELLELVLPGLRADFEAMETHVWRDEPPLACPITSSGGLRDERVGERGIASWAPYTEGGFTMRMFDGGHFYIQTHESEFLRFFRSELEKLLV